MAKNLMPEVAKLLRVEMNEEFKIKGFNRFGIITEQGLTWHQRGETNWDVSDSDLTDLLIGCLEIEKLPFKPRPGDVYWYVYWLFDVTQKWELQVGSTTYDIQHAPDNLCVAIGNCFKTREEAEVHKYEAFKRLTGMDWPRSLQRVGGDNENM